MSVFDAAAGTDSTKTQNYTGVFDGKLGFGEKCAVLVVDFCRAYTTEKSINYCGGEGFGVVDAVNQSVDLLELARSKNVPVVYTRQAFEGFASPILLTRCPALYSSVQGDLQRKWSGRRRVCTKSAAASGMDRRQPNDRNSRRAQTS